MQSIQTGVRDTFFQMGDEIKIGNGNKINTKRAKRW